MRELSKIVLKKFDDSIFISKNEDELISNFLKTIGVTSILAQDILKVFLISKKDNRPICIKNIQEKIIQNRIRENRTDLKDNIVIRRIQVWLRYFLNIKLIDKVYTGSRMHYYIFSGNKTMREAFLNYTIPYCILDNIKPMLVLLDQIDDVYGLKNECK